MNNQLEKYIIKQNFKSIINCITFLNEIGYTLKESYQLSSELFGLKININTEGLTDEELFFVECLNGCEIRIVKERYPYSIFYIKNGEVWFEQDLKNECFWCSDDNVWSILKTEFQGNYKQIETFIKTMLERHLGLGGITPNLQFFVGCCCWKDILD